MSCIRRAAVVERCIASPAPIGTLLLQLPAATQLAVAPVKSVGAIMAGVALANGAATRATATAGPAPAR